jgi:DNA-binding Lrp family transcriptional regulator
VETAIVLVHAEPAAIASLGPRLAALDGVSEVYSVTGDEDLVAIVRVHDHERIATLVTEEIAPLEGIRATRTLIAFRQYDPQDIAF